MICENDQLLQRNVTRISRHHGGIYHRKNRKGVNFEWTPAMEDAFAKIKAILVEDTILAYLHYSEHFQFHTDVSNK